MNVATARRGGCGVRAVVCALCLALAAVPAAAQQLTFHGIAWGGSPDSVRSAMDRLGYRDVDVDSLGDLHFHAPTSEAYAVFAAGRLAGLRVARPAEAGELDARFTGVTDSLRDALGSPTGTGPGQVWWVRGITFLWLEKDSARAGNPPLVTLVYQGPGLPEEVHRREGGRALPALPEPWLVLTYNDRERFAIDTAAIAPRGGGVYRARVRRSFMAVQPDPSGSFDTLVLGWDVDCTRRRVQLRTRTAILRGRTVRTDSGVTIWVPGRLGTEQANELDVVCHFVADRSAPAPPPGVS